MTQVRLYLQALRERFPTWAFLYDPFANRWFALHGRKTTLTAATAEELAAQVTHFQTHPRPTRPQPR